MADFQRSFNLPDHSKKFIYAIIDYVSIIGLMAILGATIVAILQEIGVIFEQGKVRLADLLLMFIYMEVIAMVGIYFKSHRLPVRFPIMIATVALARHIILETTHMTELQVITYVGAIFILGATAVLLKYGNRFDIYEIEQRPDEPTPKKKKK